MIKVALAANSLMEVNSIKDLLTKHCDVNHITEERSGLLFVAALTIESTKDLKIEKMFQLLEAATGIDPRKRGSKRKCVTRVCKAACYLLRYRFGLSHLKIATRLNYTSHASSLIHCKQFPETDVSERFVSIELAIKRVLNVHIEDNRKGRQKNACKVISIS